MIDVSVIIPIHNGEKWIDICMESIAKQTVMKSNLTLEIVVFNDGSTDRTAESLELWQKYFINIGINFIITSSSKSLGVGAAKNAAITCSTGEFLCFQDIDDVMQPNRICLQHAAAVCNKNALIGSKISRVPKGSTPRFENWANETPESLLNVQIYTSNGPTILMPTWFCHRSVYNKVGGFDETGHGTPEDLIFFYKHLDLGGTLIRVDKELLLYTYHEGAATFSISRKRIWQIQLNRIENIILPNWDYITIWNAGKAGRKLVRALNENARRKVTAFCDVDANKIGKEVKLYCPKTRSIICNLPVIHFSVAKPPLIICVKLDLTGGDFERNLESLNLIEGKDYILFN